MYLYLKALHVIFVVSWFAGLFYIVRLFVYYAEAQEKPEMEREILSVQYRIMTRRLWNIITYPAAVLATFFGLWMLIENSILLKLPWMKVKLIFIAMLWYYHFKCGQFVGQVKTNTLKKNGNFFRIWNEGATLILFSVVFLVVLKDAINWIFGVLGIFILAILLTLGIKYYKKNRERNQS